MTKHIGLKTMNQGAALAMGTLALRPLVQLLAGRVALTSIPGCSVERNFPVAVEIGKQASIASGRY